jgi:hypothetical protein
MLMSHDAVSSLWNELTLESNRFRAQLAAAGARRQEQLAEVQKRLKSLAAIELPRVWPEPPNFLAGWPADAYHARLAYARQRWQSLRLEVERRLQTLHLPATGYRPPVATRPSLALDAVSRELMSLWFACYCESAARYHATAGHKRRRKEASAGLPVEWVQWAAAAALIQVIRSVFMLVLLRPTDNTQFRTARPIRPIPVRTRLRLITPAPGVSLPLRL